MGHSHQIWGYGRGHSISYRPTPNSHGLCKGLAPDQQHVAIVEHLDEISTVTDALSMCSGDLEQGGHGGICSTPLQQRLTIAATPREQ